jgi:hypothetical protein
MVFLTPTKMGRAAKLKKRNASYREIARELQCSYEAVRQRLLAAAQRGDLYPQSPPGGVPIDVRTTRRIYFNIVRHPERSFDSSGKDNHVSATTFRKVASDHLLFCFIMKRKPLLNQNNRLKRLKWAAEMVDQDWISVIFTDEALVKIGDQGRRYVHCCCLCGALTEAQMGHPPQGGGE